MPMRSSTWPARLGMTTSVEDAVSDFEVNALGAFKLLEQPRAKGEDALLCLQLRGPAGRALVESPLRPTVDADRAAVHEAPDADPRGGLEDRLRAPDVDFPEVGVRERPSRAARRPGGRRRPSPRSRRGRAEDRGLSRGRLRRPRPPPRPRSSPRPRCSPAPGAAPRVPLRGNAGRAENR